MKKTLALALVCMALSGCWTTQQGQKTGTLVKVSKEGLFWGTYEGEMVRGGFDSGSGSNGREFHFTLGQTRNQNVKRAISMMEKNKPITVVYHCEAFVAPWRGENKCFLDKVVSHEPKTTR